MTGEIDVFALALSGPVDPIQIGELFTLRGLAAPGSDAVVFERLLPSGEPVQEAVASVSTDGRFRVSLQAVTSADYRARAGTLESPVAHVSVRPLVTLHARAVAGLVRLYGLVSPAQPRLPVTLQLYSRERFAWFPLARGRLNARSRVRFTLPRHQTLHLRLVLPRASDGLVGATSSVVLVRPP